MRPESPLLLEIKNLSIAFSQGLALDGVSFHVRKGQITAVVGESGSGKSLTSLAVMGLLPDSIKSQSGSILFQGEDLLKNNDQKMQNIRGNRIAMIFQEPMTALNPVYTVGDQIAEVFKIHGQKDQAYVKSLEMLKKVQIPDPERRMKEYPFQMSGGMKQRVLIAMALACHPDLLIADEPTTALDVTIQAQILKLIQNLQKELNMAVLFISHDLGVVSQIADHLVVMYGGRIVESGPTAELLNRPLHPYTQGLLASIPKLTTPRKSHLNTIEGVVPPLSQRPLGCGFRNRCQRSDYSCERKPELFSLVSNLKRQVACHKVEEELDRGH